MVESIYEDKEVLKWSNNVIFVGKQKKLEILGEKIMINNFDILLILGTRFIS